MTEECHSAVHCVGETSFSSYIVQCPQQSNKVHVDMLLLLCLQKVSLIVTVVDYDRIGTSEPIGRVVLGCNATGAWRSDHSHVIARSFFSACCSSSVRTSEQLQCSAECADVSVLTLERSQLIFQHSVVPTDVRAHDVN